MSRWQPDARGRLMEAAIELYLEHGFEQTTVARIAERAGLSERTFFRRAVLRCHWLALQRGSPSSAPFSLASSPHSPIACPPCYRPSRTR